MFVDWWLIVVIAVATGLWAEVRYRMGFRYGVISSSDKLIQRAMENGIDKFLKDLRDTNSVNSQIETMMVLKFVHVFYKYGIIQIEKNGFIRGLGRASINPSLLKQDFVNTTAEEARDVSESLTVN